jgi:hypothetical protein
MHEVHQFIFGEVTRVHRYNGCYQLPPSLLVLMQDHIALVTDVLLIIDLLLICHIHQQTTTVGQMFLAEVVSQFLIGLEQMWQICDFC